METSDLFRVEDKRLCLFRKRNVPPREPRLPVFPLIRTRFGGEGGVQHSQSAAAPIVYGSLHQRMVEKYAPPSILVGGDNKILHLSEHAGRYLVSPGGEPTQSAVKMVREELRVELQAALYQARERKEAFDSEPIPVRFNGDPRPVVLHVRPSLDREDDGLILVVFEEREPNVDGEATSAEPKETESQQVRHLEGELISSRERLQILIEEYETSKEEMKASNEELQSANEELRSTMEELETSKEELQSLNEELQSVNQQNRHKVEELSQLSSDLQNLLVATDIATLFLDRDLRILRFTPRLGDLFNIRITDRGRPISDLTHSIGYPELIDDAHRSSSSSLP
jgi:two-component system CheB/CheR fusion protein